MSAKRTTERMKFERWAERIGLGLFRTSAMPKYDSSLTQWVCLAWQAAKRQQARARVGKGER